jgi:hypothetical protein
MSFKIRHVQYHVDIMYSSSCDWRSHVLEATLREDEVKCGPKFPASEVGLVGAITEFHSRWVPPLHNNAVAQCFCFSSEDNTRVYLLT